MRFVQLGELQLLPSANSMMDEPVRFDAATKLHKYLVDTHWNSGVLSGPDPGIQWNYRIGRFVKSYLRRLPWKDQLCYLQAQGYWVLGEWMCYLRRQTDMDLVRT